MHITMHPHIAPTNSASEAKARYEEIERKRTVASLAVEVKEMEIERYREAETELFQSGM